MGTRASRGPPACSSHLADNPQAVEQLRGRVPCLPPAVPASSLHLPVALQCLLSGSLACCLGTVDLSPWLSQTYADTLGAKCAWAAAEARKRVERDNLRLLDRITELNERRRINPLQQNIACAAQLGCRCTHHLLPGSLHAWLRIRALALEGCNAHRAVGVCLAPRRMTGIAQRRCMSGGSLPTDLAGHRPGVVLDRRLRPVIDTREPAPARSLNGRARRGAAARVSAENGALLERLVSARGAYSAAAWRAGAAEQARFLVQNTL